MAFKPIDNGFSRVIFRLGGDKYHDFIRIYLAWRGIVGDLLAERSHPVKLVKKVLYVGVENSTWMQELILLKAEILKKCRLTLNNELDEIVFIIKSKRKKRI
jgi:predicted nucleic acid-binding Zn ribbon protein